MPRSALIADVRKLAKSTGKGDLKNVQDLRFNTETDEVHLSFCYGEQSTPFNIDILCGDLDQYPISRHYFISTTDQLQSHIWTADKVQKKLQTQKKSRTLREVVQQVISAAEAPIQIDSDSDDSDGDEATFDVEARDDPDSFSTSVIGTKRRRPSYSDAIDDGYAGATLLARLGARPNSLGPGLGPKRPSRPRYHTESSERARKTRISQDLRAVLDAGYSFGIIDDISPEADDVILAVSVKISTLNLPYQMLLAWSLEPRMYYVLLIHFSNGYFAYEPVNYSNIEAGLTFRIGECTQYKPTKQQAYAAFGLNYTPPPLDTDKTTHSNGASPIFKKILISSALGKIMSDSFLTILRIREKTGRSWAEALKAAIDPLVSCIDIHEPLSLSSSDRAKSLPLLAMEFAVAHLRNYTKYCQSCFGELDRSWQSLKPTTCSRDLCLYQHIQIGLTQYLEFEIICQPAVIDLLINVCYVALTPYSTRASPGQAAPAIRDFPTGLRLLVPDTENPHEGFASRYVDTTRLSIVLANNSLSGNASPVQTFAEGQWVAVGSQSAFYVWHAEIVRVDYPNSTLYLKGSKSAESIPSRCLVFKCTKNIQEVSDSLKCQYLKEILDSVPPVAHMKSLLEDPNVGSLKCIRGVSPSAVALLEWILATNRSCIVQITEKNLLIKEQSPDGIPGPPAGWLQFCLLHGPPYIEAEFEKNLAQSLAGGQIADPAYPTLLAWHGSQIQNWHSILRTGLDYNETRNGRAYGHGVYFSSDFQTSSGYSAPTTNPQWPNADMDLESMVSLNEVINRPLDFLSNTPHYVVQQRNWSRCRFLFARTRSPKHKKHPHGPPFSKQTGLVPPPYAYFMEDPRRSVVGPSCGSMTLPLATMQPRSHPVVSLGQGVGFVQTQVTLDEADMAYLNPETQPRYDTAVIECNEQANGVQGELSSDSDDDVDIIKAFKRNPRSYNAICIDGEADGEDEGGGYRRRKQEYFAKRQKTADSNEPTPAHVNTDVTPFVPGTLDHETLQILAPPSWGTATAQRALAASMCELEKVQASTPPPNLGWHIDFDKLDNLFQWVVEMHSFDNAIPLAADMRARGINSIIMEMRFGPDFPITPPLVRVVRPRFLPYMQGGGGHITAGGSVCMELLTTTGWLPSCELSSVLMQVHLAISTAQPPARLASQGSSPSRDYGIDEAMLGYQRAAATHGWSIPADFHKRKF